MSQERDNLEEPEEDLEGWLRDHPEAHDELADLQRLREVVQSIPAPQPDDMAWTMVLTRIARNSPVSAKPARSHKRLRAILSLTAAAAVLAGILLARSWWTKPAAEEPFPVVEAGDVTIISMDPRDVAALVVGEPPISGDLEFVRFADIHVIKCQRCPKSGNLPRLAQGEVPMVVTSVTRVDDPPE